MPRFGERRRPSPELITALAPLVGLIFVLALAAILAPVFFSSANLVNIARQASILGVVAIGQTVVLLVAGLDLSVGAVMGASMVVVAEVSGGRDEALPVVIVLLVVLGVVVGLGNAFLIVVRRVPPLVATLAMLILVAGARLAYTQGIPSGSIPTNLRFVGVGRIAGIPTTILVLAAVVTVMWFVLNRTGYGRRIYATGANPIAARLSGVPTGVVTASAYVICSLMAVLAGVMLSGYVGYVDRYLGQGFDLDSIAAAVVGGAALTGGKGTVGGTLIGVAFVSVLLSFLILLNAGVAAQLIVKGSVIVAAVALQRQVGQI